MRTFQLIGLSIVNCIMPLYTLGEPQAVQPGTFASCAEDLQLPRYGPSGGVGKKVGPLVVKVVPDSAGHAKSLEVIGGPESAAIIVKSWISGSTFAPRCAGKELVIQVSFIVEGTPINYPFSWVTFQRPNHFIIHSSPRIPRVFELPAETDKRGERKK